MLFVGANFLKILLAAVLLQKIASAVTNVCCHVAVINVMRTYVIQVTIKLLQGMKNWP